MLPSCFLFPPSLIISQHQERETKKCRNCALSRIVYPPLLCLSLSLLVKKRSSDQTTNASGKEEAEASVYPSTLLLSLRSKGSAKEEEGPFLPRSFQSSNEPGRKKQAFSVCYAATGGINMESKEVLGGLILPPPLFPPTRSCEPPSPRRPRRRRGNISRMCRRCYCCCCCCRRWHSSSFVSSVFPPFLPPPPHVMCCCLLCCLVTCWLYALCTRTHTHNVRTPTFRFHMSPLLPPTSYPAAAGDLSLSFYLSLRLIFFLRG